MKTAMTRNRQDEIAREVNTLLDHILTAEEKTDFVDKVRSIASDVLATTIHRAIIVEGNSIEPLNVSDWADTKDFICASSMRIAYNYRNPSRSTRGTNAAMKHFDDLIGAWN